MKCVGVYWNRPIWRSICPQNLVRTTPPTVSSLLDTWQKCSLGAVDVQDTHFVKLPSRLTELLPVDLKVLVQTTPPSFRLILFKLGISVH